MSIYTPYFYIIQDRSNGMYYAGAKWAPDANPATFMVEGGYTTSSKTINELISQHGLENFIIRKIKTFETGPEAYRYETRFLQRIYAKNNPRFYNMHSNDHLFAYHDERYKEMMIENYGVLHPLHSDCIREKLAETNMKKYGARSVFSKNSSIRSQIDGVFVNVYGVSNISQHEDTQRKIRETSVKKRGVDHHLKDYSVIQKRIDTLKAYTEEQWLQINDARRMTCMERYGDPDYRNTTKIRETNIEKYGFEIASQHPEVRRKMSASISATKNSDQWKNTKGNEARRKLSETLNSEEWKNSKGMEKSRKISEKNKGKIGSKNPNYGKKWSDEQKEKMSRDRVGAKHPQYGFIWITDGVNSQKINPNVEDIPAGWYRGRKVTRSERNDLR